MARSYPAQTMGQVAIKFTRSKSLSGKAGGSVTTHFNMSLKQADRAGAIRLDNEGKIAEILLEGVTVELPEHLEKEDVFTLPLNLPPSESDIIVPLTKEGIAGIDAKIEAQQG